MKRLAVSALAVMALIVVGCQSSDDTTTGDSNNSTSAIETDVRLTATTLCGSCGQKQGSESCCDENAVVCDCGFHKGSELCCKGVEVGKDYCMLCGHVAGEEHACKTCDSGCQICDCGMHKGADLCCKLAKE